MIIVGEKSRFAIESSITEAYEELGLRARGYLVLHIGGTSYGIRKSDATLLAVAFDEAGRILANRGKHLAPFAAVADAGEILEAISQAIHTENAPDSHFFGIPLSEFRDSIYSSQAAWHWGGDEAFDDGSCIFHYDVGDRVRIIADRPAPKSADLEHNNATLLNDVWIPQDEFYGLVEAWRNAFEDDWKAKPKQPIRSD